VSDSSDQKNISVNDADTFLAYLPYLYRFVAKLVSRKEDVEDILQETMLAAVTGYESIRDKDKIGGWLRTIAYNLSMQLLRRRYKEVEMYPRLWSPDNFNEADAAVNRIAIRQAMHTLSPNDRNMLEMYIVHGYKSSEIAEFRGLAASTIRWRIREMLHSLRDIISEEEERSHEK
jgi:RNA polymerase sigma-70 factor, ECF subfamily